MARTFLAVLVAGIAPLLVLTLIVTGTGFGLVEWQPPNIWTDQFGTPSSINEVTALTVDATSLYAAGYVGYSSSQYVHPTPSYLFLSRYDLSGRKVWTQQLGSLNFSEVSAIAVGSNSIYVAGDLSGSTFIRKYDLNGSEAQFQTGSGVGAMSLSVGPSSLFAAAGTSLREYDFDGNVVWTKTWGNSTGSRPSVFAASTEVYATSEVSCSGCNSVIAKYDFNGTLEWTRQIKDSSNSTGGWRSTGITGDATGIYVAGNYAIGRTHAGFVQKYDWDGKQGWSVQIAAPDFSGLGDISLSATTSGVYLMTTTSKDNTFLMKYNAGNGNQVWSFQIPAIGTHSVGQNGVYVGGSVSNNAGYCCDAYIADFDQSNSLILFGMNPPYSFLAVAAIAGASILLVLWQRKRYEKKARPRSSSIDYRSRNRPAETQRPQ